MLPEPSLAVFKYKHDDPLGSGWLVWAAWWLLIILAVWSFLFLGPVAVVLALILIFVVVKKWPKRQISLGPRYVVCGHTVAYYKNIRRMVLRPGHLVLFWGTNQSLKVEQERFPTNARKTHKITANKAAKFQKVSRKIIERVIAENPGVELVGIERNPAAEATP